LSFTSNSFIDPVDNLEKLLEIGIDYVHKKIIVNVQYTRYDMFEYSLPTDETGTHYHGNIKYGGPDRTNDNEIVRFDNIYSAIQFIENKYLCKVVFDSKPDIGVLSRI